MSMNMMLGLFRDDIPAINPAVEFKETTPQPIIFKKLRRFIITSLLTKLVTPVLLYQITREAADPQPVALA